MVWNQKDQDTQASIVIQRKAPSEETCERIEYVVKQLKSGKYLVFMTDENEEIEKKAS